MNYGSEGKIFVPFDRLYTPQRNVYGSKVRDFRELLCRGVDLGPPIVIRYNPHNGEKDCFGLDDGNHRAVAWRMLGHKGIYATITHPNKNPPRTWRKLRYIHVLSDEYLDRNRWVKVGLE